VLREQLSDCNRFSGFDFLCTRSTSLKRGVNESIRRIRIAQPQRENLDTKCLAFSMFILWEGTIERDTIAKLSENFWSNGCRTI
jgi:hypothetical protein